jgi:hypothetical protein
VPRKLETVCDVANDQQCAVLMPPQLPSKAWLEAPAWPLKKLAGILTLAEFRRRPVSFIIHVYSCLPVLVSCMQHPFLCCCNDPRVPQRLAKKRLYESECAVHKRMYKRLRIERVPADVHPYSLVPLSCHTRASNQSMKALCVLLTRAGLTLLSGKSGLRVSLRASTTRELRRGIPSWCKHSGLLPCPETLV